MGSVLPILTLLLLSISHILLGSVLPAVLPEPELQPVLVKRGASEYADQYDENKIHYHTEDEVQAIVDRHNERRLNVTPSASNMQIMVCQHFLKLQMSTFFEFQKY